MSLAAGRINFLPIVKDFLALVMQLVTKNDTLNADIFNKVVTFSNCFCSSCLFFFLLKNSKDLSFNVGELVTMWQRSFEGFVALLHSQLLHVIQDRLGECQITCCNKPIMFIGFI